MGTNLAYKNHKEYSNSSLSGVHKISHPVSQRAVALSLLAIDLIGIISFFVLANYTKFGNVLWARAALLFPMMLVFITLLCLYIFDLYKLNVNVYGLRAPGRTLVAVGLAGILVVSCIYVMQPLLEARAFNRSIVVFTLGLFAIWAAAWRLCFSLWMRERLESLRWLVIGDRECFDSFFRDFRKSNKNESLTLFCDNLNEFVDFKTQEDENFKIAGDWHELEDSLNYKWSGIIVATRNSLPQTLVEKLMRTRMRGVRIYSLTDFYETFWLKLPVVHLKSGWFAFSDGFYLLHNNIGLRFKRITDVLMSIVFLILLAPLMALVAVLIKLESRGPIFYKQIRSGENGRQFTLIKFRSMRTDAEKDGAKWATQNDPRITKVGKLLRKMRLDELPQLWNVFNSEMSFIGPRPERPVFNERLEKQIPYYDLRHMIKPGITGWAQVLYRYGASVEDAREKLQYDLYYIKNYSIMLDVAIVLKTIRVIFFGKGR